MISAYLKALNITDVSVGWIKNKMMIKVVMILAIFLEFPQLYGSCSWMSILASATEPKEVLFSSMILCEDWLVHSSC